MKKVQNIFLEAFFSALGQAGISYCILRNVDEVRLGDAHDVDMSLDATRLEEAERYLFQTASALGWHLHYAVGSFRDKDHYKPRHFFRIGEQGEIDIVHFDFCPTFAWNGHVVVSNATLMKDINETDLYHSVHPAAEAVIDLFIRLLYHGYIKDKYKERIHTFFHDYSERVRQILTEILSVQNTDLLMQYVAEKNWKAATDMRLLFIKDIKKHADSFRWRLLIHKAVKAYRYPGVMIAIEGTDGSGKSTIIQGMREVLKNTFTDDMIIYHHWRPNFLFRKESNPAGEVCVHPHHQTPHGKFISLLKVCACVVDYVFGYWCRDRIQLGLGRMVVYDRYYYDFYLDKIRYRLNIGDIWIRFLQFFVPSPDVTLVLTGEAEPIWRRKKEMNLEEVKEQIDTLNTCKRYFTRAVTIDVVRPVPQVVNNAAAVILEIMAAQNKSKETIS